MILKLDNFIWNLNHLVGKYISHVTIPKMANYEYPLQKGSKGLTGSNWKIVFNIRKDQIFLRKYVNVKSF